MDSIYEFHKDISRPRNRCRVNVRGFLVVEDGLWFWGLLGRFAVRGRGAKRQEVSPPDPPVRRRIRQKEMDPRRCIKSSRRLPCRGSTASGTEKISWCLRPRGMNLFMKWKKTRQQAKAVSFRHWLISTRKYHQLVSCVVFRTVAWFLIFAISRHMVHLYNLNIYIHTYK